VSKIAPCVIVSYFTIQPLNEMIKVTLFIKGGIMRAILFALSLMSTTFLAGEANSRTWPDSFKTPGATNPKVTQANIKRTICRSGWTKTIRPPSSYTTALKRQQIAEYGYRNKKPGSYEEDHLISLQLGGDRRTKRTYGRKPTPVNAVRG
jgi:hypothetical protein